MLLKLLEDLSYIHARRKDKGEVRLSLLLFHARNYFKENYKIRIDFERHALNIILTCNCLINAWFSRNGSRAQKSKAVTVTCRGSL
jgi:hypothetical protein